MNFLKYPLFVLFICLNLNCRIEIIESFEESLETVSNASEDSLIIFDIDRTLVKPQEENSFNNESLRFLKARIDQYLKKTKNYANYINLLRIVYKFKQILTEECIVKIIDNLQEKNIKIIALTSCYTKPNDVIIYGKYKFELLKDFKIDFSTSFKINNFKFTNLPTVNESYPEYYKGIILTNTIEKGKVLTEFFKQVKWQPKEVIFFDDQLTNLLNVEEHLKSLDSKIKYIGYHFIKTDLTNFNIDYKVLDFQINYFIEKNTWVNASSLNLFSFDEII